LPDYGPIFRKEDRASFLYSFLGLLEKPNDSSNDACWRGYLGLR